MGTQYVCQHKLKLFLQDKLATSIILFTKFTASPIMSGLSASPQSISYHVKRLFALTGNPSYSPQLRDTQQVEPSVTSDQPIRSYTLRSYQNAVQRLLFRFEEHSCCMGMAGLQSRVLFGSDILTCVIAAVSASTMPDSSWSSDLWLDESEADDSQCDLILSHGSLGATTLLVTHTLGVTAFRVHSV
jgi:hypothetical protein